VTKASIRKLCQSLPAVPGPARICVVAAAVLVLYRVTCSGRFYRETVAPLLDLGPDDLLGLGAALWKSLATCVLLAAIPAAFTILVERRGPAEHGLAAGDAGFGLRVGALLVALMLPVVAAASCTGTFADHYPLARAAAGDGATFLAYQAAMLVYFLAWEYFFRGWLLFGLHRHLGDAAVWIQMIPFALLHGSKPLPEALGSIFVGVLLGYFALRTRTFLYCALVHFVIAAAMDVAAVLQRGGFGAP
jgi:hypothetical protein